MPASSVSATVTAALATVRRAAQPARFTMLRSAATATLLAGIVLSGIATASFGTTSFATTGIAEQPITANVGDITQYDVEVLERKPQSRKHFVQGLEIVDGKLYVSTGLYGQSKLLRYDFASGELEVARDLGGHLFGEGLTVLDNTIYQLTWRKRRLLIYDKATMTLKSGWTIPGQGWGLTNDGAQLIYSDGSDQLHFVSTENGAIVRTIGVTENGVPLRLINELEWVNGQIWANVWGGERIVVIDPVSGIVQAQINLSGLLPADERQANTDVLNGIARDPATGDIWVTGKRWPWLYKIQLQPQS